MPAYSAGPLLTAGLRFGSFFFYRPITVLVLTAVAFGAAATFFPVVCLAGLPGTAHVTSVLVDHHGGGVGRQDCAASLYTHEICTGLEIGDLIAGDSRPELIAGLLIFHGAVHAGDRTVVVIGSGAVILAQGGSVRLRDINGLYGGIIGGDTVAGRVDQNVHRGQNAGEIQGRGGRNILPGGAAVKAVLRANRQVGEDAAVAGIGIKNGVGSNLPTQSDRQRNGNGLAGIVGGVVTIALLGEYGQTVAAGSQRGDIHLDSAGVAVIGKATIEDGVVFTIQQESGDIFVGTKGSAGIVQLHLAAIHSDGKAAAAVVGCSCDGGAGGVEDCHFPCVGLFGADCGESAVHRVGLAAHSRGGEGDAVILQIHSGAGGPVQIDLTVYHLAIVGNDAGVHSAAIAGRAQPPAAAFITQLGLQLGIIVDGADILCQLIGGQEEDLFTIQRGVVPRNVVQAAGTGGLVGFADCLQFACGKCAGGKVGAPCLGVAAGPCIAVRGALVKINAAVGSAAQQFFCQQEDAVAAVAGLGTVQHAPLQGAAAVRAEIHGVAGLNSGQSLQDRTVRSGSLCIHAHCRSKSQ